MFKRIGIEITDWLDSFFSSLPGHIGVKIRSGYYRKRFQKNVSVVIESGCVFENPSSMLFGHNVSIGKGSFFGATLGKIRCGSNTAFNACVHINASPGGEIIIGDNCLIGPRVSIFSTSHIFSETNQLIREQGHKADCVSIGNDCWIGANSVIVNGVKIGDGVVVGAGAVVTHDISAYCIVAGVPARIIKRRDEG